MAALCGHDHGADVACYQYLVGRLGERIVGVVAFTHGATRVEVPLELYELERQREQLGQLIAMVRARQVRPT